MKSRSGKGLRTGRVGVETVQRCHGGGSGLGSPYRIEKKSAGAGWRLRKLIVSRTFEGVRTMADRGEFIHHPRNAALIREMDPLERVCAESRAIRLR